MFTSVQKAKLLKCKNSLFTWRKKKYFKINNKVLAIVSKKNLISTSENFFVFA